MLVFVDEAGGELSSIAASVAAARGLAARAETTVAATPHRPEVVQALQEIGVTSIVRASVASPPNRGETVFRVGAGGDIDVALYDGPASTAFGPADLERNALARIARDRIERWLDSYSGSQR